MNIFNRKKPKSFFSAKEEASIVSAIKQAEQQTSGEIKVHVESNCETHPFERAVDVFAQLEMHLTRQRNGVLFYLAIKDHKFAIVADEGINSVVDDGFWDEISEDMERDFKAGKVAEGLRLAVLSAGEQLKRHFPYNERDENEISDEISMGD